MGHGHWLIVNAVRNEEIRHGVSLTTQERKVKLPQILQARG